MSQYILAIDQGTTSSRALVYDQNLSVVGVGQEAFPQHFPQSGWVEHDLNEIWTSVQVAIEKALQSTTSPHFSPKQIVGIGITNQRETFGLWDKKTGEAIGPAIVWQCRRSAAICEKLKKGPKAKRLSKITGLVVDPYFSGTKLKWRFDEDKNLRKKANEGNLAFGTIDTFLISKLTNNEVHATDASNASRTLMMDLAKGKWSAEALKILGIPEGILPQIKDSNSVFGVTSGLRMLPDNIPICGVLGDQQAALFGQACFSKGEAKITYGTGAFFLINTGNQIKKTEAGVSTLAWSLNGKKTFALEGSVFVAGAAVQWLRDGLGLFLKSSDVESLARQVNSTEGVFFIPALSGLGAPDWAPHARGLIGGISRGTKRAHIARAALEGIAFSVADAFSELVLDSGAKLKTLRVDGGAARNSLLLQAQSDILQSTIERPSDIESTARGAASMAAMSLGIVSQDDLASKNPIELKVLPRLSKGESKKSNDIWRRRVKALVEGAY